MNLRELKEIFRLIEKTDFTQVEIVQGDVRLRVERGKSAAGAAPIVYAAPMPTASELSTEAQESAPSPAETPKAASEPAAEAKNEREALITSPFVGTFYRAPSPEAPPYVEVGQTVKVGQALCIVEAMKLMNEIESDFDGKIVEIYPKNAQPVEFGEKLFRIELSR